jgi:hypothetical protein
VATLPESVDYTDKDFDALRARLIALIKSVFPDWTDFDVASFGNLLVELYAYVGDVLTFYQDNLARESRLVTATQRKSVMALAKMLGYRLHGAQAATAEVWLQLARVPVASVTIPAGTVLRTQEVTEPVRFQLLAPAVIAAAADPPRVSRWSRTRRRTRSSSTRAGSPTSSCISTSPRTSTTRPSSRRRRVRSPRSTASSTRARTTGTSWSPSTRTTARRCASATA